MDVRILLFPMRENPPTVKANSVCTGKPRGHTSQASRRKSARQVQGHLSRWRWVQNSRFSFLKPPERRLETQGNRKKLIQQSEKHPNRYSLIHDLNKTEEFNPFSEKSMELITSMGNTEYFELCETSSKIQSMPWLSFILGKRTFFYCTCGPLHAAYRKESTVEQGKRRRPANSRLRYQKESHPQCQTWTICAAAHVSQSTWCAEESPQAQKWCLQNHSGFMARCWQIPRSLCQILGELRNRSFNVTKSHWKIIPTCLHGKKEVGTENPGKFLWMQKVFKDHWISAVTFLKRSKNAKRLYDEHTPITGDGNKPIPLAQQVRQRLDQQFEGLEEYGCRLEPRTGWPFHLSSRTTHSSSSSHWQQSSDWKSNRSWDSWQTSSWTEQFFFLLLCSETPFRLPKI